MRSIQVRFSCPPDDAATSRIAARTPISAYRAGSSAALSHGQRVVTSPSVRGTSGTARAQPSLRSLNIATASSSDSPHAMDWRFSSASTVTT